MSELRIICGSASPRLADAIIARCGGGAGGCVVERFPDGEVRPIVENVAGCDVYVVQSTSPPVAEHLVELLLILDACRRAYAGRITAVLPYFGYARQDRRTAGGQALGVRLAADTIAQAGA